jgi:hypothetical protein
MTLVIANTAKKRSTRSICCLLLRQNLSFRKILRLPLHSAQGDILVDNGGNLVDNGGKMARRYDWRRAKTTTNWACQPDLRRRNQTRRM